VEFYKALGHRIKSHVKDVASVGMVDGKKPVVHRNASVSIDEAIQPKAEDVLDRLVMRFDF